MKKEQINDEFKEKLRRTYLSAEEKNFYMITKAYIQTVEGQRNLEGKMTEEIWEEWKKRGMMTASMQRNLKMAHTCLKKFIYEIECNMNQDEMKRLKKQSDKSYYKFIDDYTAQKLMRDIRSNLQYAVLQRDQFEDVMEEIAQVRCVGCKDDYRQCSIHKALDDASVPYCSEEPNCPYAADLSKFSLKEKKHIEELKEKLHKKNQFYKEA